ncbi:MAG: two-component sensor histidine kinase [Sphingomonadales bacterium]|nr:two-component sensor histidine kinase [Sphingomonadales bacterium]MBD3773109.1 two-component sensor histidine kinase [Paracoccaceae bacterium]
MRLFPRSLLGQMLLAVGLALLIAQAVSGVLLWRAGERQREGATLNQLAFRFIAGELVDPARRPATRRDEDDERDHRRGFRLREVDSLPPFVGGLRDSRREDMLREILKSENVPVADLVVVAMAREQDPMRRNQLRPLAARLQGIRPAEQDRLLFAALRRHPGEAWLVARVSEQPRNPGFLAGIVVQTLVTYVVLVGLLALLLRRVTRPLADLTGRIRQFGATRDASGQIEPRGPEDIRGLISAHNALETRIATLLDEKDVMLGAIGHDLKTPLAALRVRIESVPDATQRDKMARTIEEITATLDDILTLARVGKGDGPPERAELSALAASVVEEFEDMGQPVSLGETARIAAPVHVTWLNHALRNLVGNAVRYGGGAQVEVARDGDRAVLRVLDNGPGIPDSRIAAMMEPFARGEASRNRATGGAGLGLAIARAVAEQHGGTLVLRNRAEGGLCAEISLPG